MPTSLNDVTLLIDSGDLVQAQALLAYILKHDLRNAQAWFLLARCVTDPVQRRQCLQRTLALDPSHSLARALLDAQPPAIPQIIEIPPPASQPFQPREYEPPTDPQSFQPRPFALAANLSPEPFNPQPFQLDPAPEPPQPASPDALPVWLRNPQP